MRKHIYHHFGYGDWLYLKQLVEKDIEFKKNFESRFKVEYNIFGLENLKLNIQDMLDSHSYHERDLLDAIKEDYDE